MILRLCTFAIYLLLGCLIFEQLHSCIVTGDGVECNKAETIEADESFDEKWKDGFSNILLSEDALHTANLGKCSSIFFLHHRFRLMDCLQTLAYGAIFSPPPNIMIV